MGAHPPVTVVDRASVSVVRDQVRAVSAAAGLSLEATERLALAASELAQNQLDHAREGQVLARRVERDGVGGVEIVATDRGSGIADPAGALDGTTPGRGLGVGLASVRRMVEELDLDVRAGEGTTVIGRRFASPVRREPEIAVLGRGLELPSGDVAVTLRAPDRLVLAVVDGAGHGPLAREVADRAAAAVHPRASAKEILARMDEALVGLRGAAGTVAVVDRSRVVTLIGVGNVAAWIAAPTGVQRYLPRAGMLGVAHRPAPTERSFVLPPLGCLVLCTDGLSTSAARENLAGRSAVQAAQHLLTTHHKPHDDALVLVVR